MNSKVIGIAIITDPAVKGRNHLLMVSCCNIENSFHFPALPALEKRELFNHNDGFLVHQFSVVSQYGTYIDAPIHFVKGEGGLRRLI